jgi:2-polyprenyl-6-methoxyphenol hydroxylase-like FAD-dependent oxidoreductase
MIGKQAVVIGAGMAGLPAARTLSDFFERVVVLENDPLPRDAVSRPGTPQCKHLHALLAGGERALSTLFPGFQESLSHAGAQSLSVSADYWLDRPGYEVFPQRDLGFRIMSMTRPLAEMVVRRRVAAIGNVEIRERCRAQEIVPAEGSARVIALTCTHSGGETEQLPADLVVDASSHGQLTLSLLEALGIPPPEETTVGVNLAYATAVFEIPADAPPNWKIASCYSDPPRNRRGALLMPIEGNAWMVALIGGRDSRPPDDEGGFLEHARQLRTPTIYNAIRGARHRSQISLYGFKASRWRHFERLTPFPAGLIPLGDTICRFNPIYGQGMSVAAKEALLLHDLLRAAAQEGAGLESVAADFLAQAQPIVDAPWATAVIPDFLDPLTEGQRPADLESALRYGAALVRIAHEDADVHRQMLEVQHLLKPRSTLREPAIAERVNAVMAAA